MAVNVGKISVAIGREELAWAQRRARRLRSSVSAVLTEAARRMQEDEAREARQRLAWAEYEAWATAEHGPLTDADLDAARRDLESKPVGPSTPARGRKRRVA